MYGHKPLIIMLVGQVTLLEKETYADFAMDKDCLNYIQREEILA